MQLPMTTSYQWWYCVGGKATSGSVCALEERERKGPGTHLVDGERAGDEEGAELQASREKSQMLSMQAGDACVHKLKDGKSGSREGARALDEETEQWLFGTYERCKEGEHLPELRERVQGGGRESQSRLDSA